MLPRVEFKFATLEVTLSSALSATEFIVASSTGFDELLFILLVLFISLALFSPPTVEEPEELGVRVFAELGLLVFILLTARSLLFVLVGL